MKLQMASKQLMVVLPFQEVVADLVFYIPASAPYFKKILGVEFALRSHEVLRQDADLQLSNRRLLGHHLVPGGGRWEALIIDDYFCIGAEPVGQSPLNSFAFAALAKARAAYERHGLEGTSEKDMEAQPIFKAAGAEVISTLEEACRLGVASVAAPMAKRIALSSLT